MTDLETSGIIFTGRRGQYYWLTSTEQYMDHLVQLCPDILLGRYLVVTSIDGGIPWLTDAQRAADWKIQSGMAYSDRLSSVEELFYQRDGKDCPGYDEWYVFDTVPNHLGEILHGNPFEEGNKPQPGRLLVFVGWAAFILHDSDPAVQTINEMFWQQLEWIQPDLYISDGRENLTFLCKEQELFTSVHHCLSEGLHKLTT